MMATRKGLVKKTALAQYGRPLKGGLIAIKLKEGDELVDVVITKAGDEVVLSTARGMAIRFNEADSRSMGRNTSGVKGINLTAGDELVGMVVAEPEATLLSLFCQNGYGKRTLFGPNEIPTGEAPADDSAGDEAPAVAPTPPAPAAPVTEAEGEEGGSSSSRYRTQRRGGKGLRDIKTTDRNGPVISVVSVVDGDEVLIMTARGKLQRPRGWGDQRHRPQHAGGPNHDPRRRGHISGCRASSARGGIRTGAPAELFTTRSRGIVPFCHR